MSENLKMLWSFAMMLGVFAYFMNRGAKDLGRLSSWACFKARTLGMELYAMHCEVRHLRKLQKFRRWFNRHPGIRSVRDITFLLLLMLVAIPAFATDRCIRAAGDNSAAGTCTAWGSTACTNFSSVSSLARGDTVYFATGSYSQITANLAASGSSTVTLKPATVADHGSCSGWSDAYAGQPSIAGMHLFTNYWVIDGGRRNESDWGDGAAYGFRFTSGSDVAAAFFSSYSEPSDGQPCPDNITIKYVNMGNTDIGNTYDAADPSGVYTIGILNGGGDTCDNWVIQRNYTHNTRVGFFINSATNFTIEYNYGLNNFAKEWIRGGADSAVSKGHTIRYNYMKDACEQVPGDASGLCDAEIGIWGSLILGANDDIKIYGNVIYVTTSEQHTGGCIFVGGDDNVAYFGDPGNNIEIYNNTCAGIESSQAGILINGGIGSSSGNLCKNNLFYDDVSTPDCLVGGGTAANNVEVTSDPFVSYATGNLRLASNTATGTTLASPYNQDMDGTTRGVPAAWSLGAFQFTTGGGGGSGSALYIATMAIWILMIFLLSNRIIPPSPPARAEVMVRSVHGRSV